MNQRCGLNCRNRNPSHSPNHCQTAEPFMAKTTLIRLDAPNKAVRSSFTPWLRRVVACLGSSCLLAVAHGEVYIAEVARWHGPPGVVNPVVADVALRGDVAYVLDRNKGLYFLGVTNPSAPRFLASAKQANAGTRLALDNGYVYVIDGYTKYVQAYNVSDPFNAPQVANVGIGSGSPAYISACAEPGRNLLYLGGDGGYFRVVDVSNPVIPVESSMYPNAPPVQSILVTEKLAYVALDSGGLRVLDVSIPTSRPTLLYTVDVATGSSKSMGVAVRYPYAYVACTSRGLRVVNCLTEKEVPPGAATSGPATDVVLDGNLAYVACGPGGVEVFDITDPTLPVSVGRAPTAKDASAVRLRGGYAYVVCGSQGLAILAVDLVGAGLGRTVVQAGTTGAVPVNLLSWVDLTNLAFNVSYPADRLTDFRLNITSPQIVDQRLTLIDSGLLEVSLTLAGGNVLGVLTNIGTLSFAAVSNQPSAFLTFNLTELVGRRSDGNVAWHGQRTDGRVVVVGQEPMLEIVTNSDRSHWLSIYSLPGFTTQVLSSTNFAESAFWPPKYEVWLTNLSQSIGPLQTTNRTEWLRALRIGSP